MGEARSHGPVMAAVVGNLVVTIAKFAGFAISGSSAMLAEALHSLADTMNQGLLWVGLERSKRRADAEHQFGYGQERYFWSLVSAITIFFLGGGYTIMHAVEQLLAGAHAPMHWSSLAILGVAFVVESFTLAVAVREFNRQRRAAGRSFRAWLTETRDPTTLAVMVEDSVAVVGVAVAAAGILLADRLRLDWFDPAAAIVIGLLMGGLAIFLANLNRGYLISHADPELNELAMRAWREDPRVERVERVNSIVLGPDVSLLMAEVELREEAMFEDMSDEEVKQLTLFMQRLDAIRRELEAGVRERAPRARAIFLEFTLPGGKDPISQGVDSRAQGSKMGSQTPSRAKEDES